MKIKIGDKLKLKVGKKKKSSQIAKTKRRRGIVEALGEDELLYRRKKIGEIGVEFYDLGMKLDAGSGTYFAHVPSAEYAFDFNNTSLAEMMADNPLGETNIGGTFYPNRLRIPESAEYLYFDCLFYKGDNFLSYDDPLPYDYPTPETNESLTRHYIGRVNKRPLVINPYSPINVPSTNYNGTLRAKKTGNNWHLAIESNQLYYRNMDTHFQGTKVLDVSAEYFDIDIRQGDLVKFYIVPVYHNFFQGGFNWYAHLLVDRVTGALHNALTFVESGINEGVGFVYSDITNISGAAISQMFSSFIKERPLLIPYPAPSSGGTIVFQANLTPFMDLQAVIKTPRDTFYIWSAYAALARPFINWSS